MLKLFTTFFKIGLFTFGGGYAMLPLLKYEIVEKNKWATDDDLLNYFSIGQCTPGIIAVNVSTFIGYKVNGKIGAVVSTLGIITPSIFIITLIAAILNNFMDNHYVASALAGVRIGVCALLLSMLIDLGKKSIKDRVDIALLLVAFLLLFVFNLSAVWIVVVAILFGLVRGFKK